MMILSPWLFLLLGLAAGPDCRVVHEGGAVISCHADALPRELLAWGRAHAWCWSVTAAPAKVKGTRTLSTGLLTSSALKISMPPGTERRSVVAAPIEMWEEIPEEELPTWTVPQQGKVEVPYNPSEAWRIRVIGDTAGSLWQDVPPGSTQLRLSPTPAQDVPVEILGPDGNAVDSAWLQLYARSEGVPSYSALLRIERGLSILRSLPSGHQVVAVISVADMPTRLVSLTTAGGPVRVNLTSGVKVAGRFLDKTDRPLGGVEAVVETWVSDSPILSLRRTCVSSSDGRCVLGALPAGRALFRASKKGVGSYAKELLLGTEDSQLGDIALTEGLSVGVSVRDQGGAPIEGVELTTKPSMGDLVHSDSRGEALLADLPEDGLVRIRAHKLGYLNAEVPVALPAARLELVMQAAFTIQGRIISGATGQAVGQARLKAQGGSRLTFGVTEGDGSFRLELEPGREYLLSMSTPRTMLSTVHVGPGEAGEVRDLGDLEALDGRSVSGRVVSPESGAGIPQAIVRSFRVGSPEMIPGSPLEEYLVTQADSSGYFRLSGLDGTYARLVTSAIGYAKDERMVALTLGLDTQDIGEIVLRHGATVELEVEPPPGDGEGIDTHLDLTGEWLESKILSAPLRSGRATFANVPSGRAVARVLRGNSVLCEEPLEVSADAEYVTVICRTKQLKVFGNTLVDGLPAPSGVLTWLPPAPRNTALILVTTSPLGLENRVSYGAGRPPVQVAVGVDGTFVTEDLSPGEWSVSWSGSGAGTESKTIVIPQAISTLELQLTFGGARLSGRVVDEQGNAVEGAEVREAKTGMSTLSVEDGGFALMGSGTGEYVLKASLGEKASPAVPVVIQDGKPASPVELVLQQRRNDRIATVRVVDATGVAMAGSFVIAEDDQFRQWIVTTDVTGLAKVPLEPSTPGRIRFAASGGGRFVFGGYLASAEAVEKELLLMVGETGALLLDAGGGEDDVAIRSASGWDVSSLMRRLGRPLRTRPGDAAIVTGLPPGVYYVEARGRPGTVEIRGAETARLQLK